MASSEVQNGTSADRGEPLDGAGGLRPSFPLDAVRTLIACLAVLGNGMVIAVMRFRRRAFGSSINRLIMHQSALDGLAGAVFFCSQVLKSPSTVVVSLRGTLADEFVCRVVFTDYLLWSLNVTSTYNLVVISLERLLAICYPRSHRGARFTSLVRAAVVASWLIGFVHSSHLMFLVRPKGGRCQFFEMSRSLRSGLGIAVLSVEFLVPVSIMAYSYVRIMLTFMGRLAQPLNARQRFIRRARKNIIVTVLGTAVLFILCWTPVECYYMGALLTDQGSHETFYTVSTTILACNLFVNPINYSFLNRRFRRQLRNMLRGRCRQNRVQGIHI